MSGSGVLTEDDGPVDNGAGGAPPADGGAGDGLPSPLRSSNRPAINSNARASEPDVEYDIIETDDNGDDLGGAPAPQQQQPDDTKPAYQPRGEYDDQRSQQPWRDETPGDKRRRRRDGRRQTLQENARLKAELDELKTQVAGITPRIGEMQMEGVRQRLNQMEGELQRTNVEYVEKQRAFFRAIQEGNEDAAAQLDQQKNALAIKQFQLTEATREVRKALDSGVAVGPDGGAQGQRPSQQQPQQRAPQQLNPVAEQLKQQFLREDAPWIGQPGTEQDFRILTAIDDQIAADGFDPNSSDYWDELWERSAKILPHRFAQNGQPPVPQPQQQRQTGANAQRQALQARNPQNRGPQTTAPGTRPAQNSNRQQVRIGPERREALQAAGVIDNRGSVLDRAKFNKIVKGYAEFDAENANRSAGR